MVICFFYVLYSDTAKDNGDDDSMEITNDLDEDDVEKVYHLGTYEDSDDDLAEAGGIIKLMKFGSYIFCRENDSWWNIWIDILCFQ